MKHPSTREPEFSQTVGGEPPDKIEKMPMREALSRYKSFNQSPAQMVFDDLERRRIVLSYVEGEKYFISYCYSRDKFFQFYLEFFRNA